MNARSRFYRMSSYMDANAQTRRELETANATRERELAVANAKQRLRCASPTTEIAEVA